MVEKGDFSKCHGSKKRRRRKALTSSDDRGGEVGFQTAASDAIVFVRLGIAKIGMRLPRRRPSKLPIEGHKGKQALPHIDRAIRYL
jgi:hypothetical protein